jgi:hypothetical protein
MPRIYPKFTAHVKEVFEKYGGKVRPRLGPNREAAALKAAPVSSTTVPDVGE